MFSKLIGFWESKTEREAYRGENISGKDEGAMAKMKEMEKERTEEVVGSFVRMVVLYKA